LGRFLSVGFCPFRGVTPQVQVFYCVLALTVCGLLRRELDRRGIRRSLPALLEELRQIREVHVVYPAIVAGEDPTIQII
jgi:hypothetical protein